jgi:hypothetical protein
MGRVLAGHEVKLDRLAAEAHPANLYGRGGSRCTFELVNNEVPPVVAGVTLVCVQVLDVDSLGSTALRLGWVSSGLGLLFLGNRAGLLLRCVRFCLGGLGGYPTGALGNAAVDAGGYLSGAVGIPIGCSHVVLAGGTLPGVLLRILHLLLGDFATLRLGRVVGHRDSARGQGDQCQHGEER